MPFDFMLTVFAVCFISIRLFKFLTEIKKALVDESAISCACKAVVHIIVMPNVIVRINALISINIICVTKLASISDNQNEARI